MNKEIRFLLNLQILTDELLQKFPGARFFRGEDRQCLEGVRFFRPGTEMVPKYAYLAKAEEVACLPVPAQHCSLILLGEPSRSWTVGSHSILALPEEAELLDVMNLCQEAFDRNFAWADRLRCILVREGSVDDLCRASYEYFENPLFVHDSQFHIISCPVWREGMMLWRKDERTGLLLTPLEELNELKTDQEYLGTLTTRGADIFSAELRGYRDIYVNIWDDYGVYEGRLVICELENALKPGQFAAAEFLASLVGLTLARRGHVDRTYKRALYQMLEGMVHGETFSDAEVETRLLSCGWKRKDPYVCIRMDAREREESPGSAASVCNYAEGRVAGCKAFYTGSRICILINLSQNDHYTSDIAEILRDGLFKAGISNVFHDFIRFRHYYQQASVALDCCRKRNDTMWYYTFNDIVMDYISDLCCSEFEPEDLCAPELKKLQEYDAANRTELYKTLCTYLLQERNTVAASAQLYVGRSTLFYRLRKIREITGLDAAAMAEPVQNLYLRLSIHILGRAGKTGLTKS